ncbi:MAG: cation transporter, partial [Acidobacteria bacterium]|nr:cation transporter [Acidobacteriota bacterium]
MTVGGACDLCGASAARNPQVQTFRGHEQRFCCTGCLNVYGILLESGAIEAGVDLKTTTLYQESLRLGLLGRGEVEATPVPEGLEQREALYQIGGMWCAACGWVIEHALHREPGIVSAEVLFTSDLLKVTYCPQLVPPGTVPDRVQALGYRAAEFGTEPEGDRRQWQDMLLRLGIAGGMWMNVMLFSLVIYASYWESISGWAQHFVPFILMGLSLPAVLYSAWPIHRIAWFGLRSGHLRMEALISTGVLAAFVYSSVQAFVGGRHFYFDTACAIVTLVLTGKALERGAKDRSAKAIAMLHRLLPRKARLRLEGQEHFVAIEALEPGAVFLVKPGERIPADGIVVDGQSAVDESVVTGESDPRTKAPGQAVICGSLRGPGVPDLHPGGAGPGGPHLGRLPPAGSAGHRGPPSGHRCAGDRLPLCPGHCDAPGHHRRHRCRVPPGHHHPRRPGAGDLPPGGPAGTRQDWHPHRGRLQGAPCGPGAPGLGGRAGVLFRAPPGPRPRAPCGRPGAGPGGCHG